MGSFLFVRVGFPLLVSLAFCLPALGARITTKDGTVLNGEVEGLQDGTYTVRTPYGSIQIPQSSVTRIENGARAPATPASDVQSTTPAGGGDVVRLAGSTTIGDELMPALVERFATSGALTQMHWTADGGDPAEQTFAASGDGRTFAAHLSRHGSATAFTALADGKADIGMASRPVNADEAAKLGAAGFGVANAVGQEHVLALDGLVVLVNRANPVASLSLAQLGDIFSGQVADWGQVGGTPGPIHVLGRDSKSGTADTFNGIVMKGRKVGADARLMDSSDGLSDAVASDPAAIGFAGFAYTRRAKALSILTDCGLETAPSDFFVRTEEYPLSRRLFLYTRAPAGPESDAQRLVAFSLGRAGQEVVAGKGFVDLLPRLSAPDYSATRIATALSQVARMPGDTSSDMRQIQVFNKIADGGRRVSVTFRFRTASFDLDTRAVSDIDRLVSVLKSPDMAGRDLTLLGFSDAQGSAARNVRLALARAERVAGLLRARGVVARAVLGLGRSAPVACNSSPEGLEKNRRVEVWLGPRRS